MQDMKNNAQNKPHNAQQVNQYCNYTNQSFMHGRTMANMGPQPQVVPHQANSLASNHASKISNFSKSTHQKQVPSQNYAQEGENNQQHLSGTAGRTHYHKNLPIESNNQQQRNQSDEIGHSSGNQGLLNNGRYFNIQGNTVVNTNVKGSLVGSMAQNTHNFNTAMGSSIASHREKNKMPYGSKQHKNTSVSNTKNKETSVGHKSAGTGTKSSLNRNQGNGLKQTAQFGPQMNLMKSQLPHQQPGTQESRKDVKSKLISDRNQANPGKMNILRKNQQVAGQSSKQQSHYLTASS